MIPFFSKLSPCLIGVEACGTHIIGRARSPPWAMRFRSFPRLTSRPMSSAARAMRWMLKQSVKRCSARAMRFVPAQNCRTAECSHDASRSVVACSPTDHGRKRLAGASRRTRSRCKSRYRQSGGVGTSGPVRRGQLAAYAQIALDILIRSHQLTDEIAALDSELRAWHTENEASRGWRNPGPWCSRPPLSLPPLPIRINSARVGSLQPGSA